MECLQIYFRDVARNSLISPDEELRLAKLARAGDTAAKQALVVANLRLAINVSKQFKATGVPLEDMIQAANLGLLRAAERFDPYRLKPDGKPYRFSGYATWWLKNFLRIECWLLRSIIRIPNHLQVRWSELAPDVERVMDVTPINSEAIPEEAIADPWDPLEELGEAEYLELQITKLRRGLRKLPKRDRLVVRLRMQGQTQAAIGQRLGVCKERVRQLEFRSFEKLREFFMAEAA